MRDRDRDIDDLIRRKVDRRRERVKDSSDLITHDAAIDLRTRKLLFSMLNRRILLEIQGILSTGKEANVYTGRGRDGSEVAIKIYRINSQTSKWMGKYIAGDPRFATFRKRNTRNLITTWAMKEFKNLQRASEVGVRCPRPVHVKENVLVMGFIGKDGTPARKLTEITLDDPLRHFVEIVKGMRALFRDAQLVHGDLSPFNLLYHENKVYFIDFAQGVLVDHPHAREYLERDIDNVLAFFQPALPESFDRDHMFRAIVHGDPLNLPGDQ